MFKSGREKTILKQGLILIGIIIVVYIFVLSPFLNEGSNIMDEELERKTTELKKYISRTGSMPSKKSFNKLEKENLAMEDKLQAFIDFVDPEKVRISEGSSEAGLYFIERLHSSMKRFSKEASAKGLKIPENLGFGDGLPKESMVDALLRQLETVELVLDILLKNKNVEIATIKPLKSIDYIEPLSKELFYTELPVQISMKMDTKGFADLFLQLKNASPIVSIREMHIKSFESEMAVIEASLVLSSFKIAKKKKL